MGVCASAELREEQRRNKDIDKTLENDRKMKKTEAKVLLLGEIRRCGRVVCHGVDRGITGAGESGKSTVVKQMKIINMSGYTDLERKNLRSAIFNNVLQSAQTLVGAMRDLNISWENQANEVRTGDVPAAHYTISCSGCSFWISLWRSSPRTISSGMYLVYVAYGMMPASSRVSHAPLNSSSVCMTIRPSAYNPSEPSLTTIAITVT